MNKQELIEKIKFFKGREKLGVLTTWDELIETIDQLDEPEVLTQEWIDENEVFIFDLDDDCEIRYVPSLKLRHLLVPKQELPAIPKFVANWIEEIKKQNKSIVFAIAHIYDKNEIGESPTKEENRIFQWMESANNDELFARAWLDGYEVEEEQKYHVLFGNQPHDDNWTYVLTNSGSIEIFEKDVLLECDRTKLTEQEIKDYDPRYWAFAEPVEEVDSYG